MSQPSAITNVRIFDGDRVLNDTTVVIDGPVIRAVGGAVPRTPSLSTVAGVLCSARLSPQKPLRSPEDGRLSP